MQKLIWLTLLCALLVCSSVFAQDHLLITEFAVDPSSSTAVGEFIEIFNPTTETIDLTNYYLTDATFSGGGTFYYQIVEGGGGGGGFGDWHARFPTGATIAPGEFQTMSLPGSIDFMAQYDGV
ncbi:MAG: lamin tail domain-containing protein, partial [Gammaproteobacteria bacterium]